MPYGREAGSAASKRPEQVGTSEEPGRRVAVNEGWAQRALGSNASLEVLIRQWAVHLTVQPGVEPLQTRLIQQRWKLEVGP